MVDSWNGYLLETFSPLSEIDTQSKGCRNDGKGWDSSGDLVGINSVVGRKGNGSDGFTWPLAADVLWHSGGSSNVLLV